MIWMTLFPCRRILSAYRRSLALEIFDREKRRPWDVALGGSLTLSTRVVRRPHATTRAASAPVFSRNLVRLSGLPQKFRGIVAFNIAAVSVAVIAIAVVGLMIVSVAAYGIAVIRIITVFNNAVSSIAVYSRGLRYRGLRNRDPSRRSRATEDFRNRK